MYRDTTTDDIRRADMAYEHRRAATIAEALKGNSNSLDEHIYSAIYAIDGRVHSMDPPLILDYDIHDLWHLFIEAAKNYDIDNTKQDKLVFQILYIR